MTVSYTQTTTKENNNMSATRRRSLRLSTSNSNDVVETVEPVASSSKVLLQTATKTKSVKPDTKKRKLKVEPGFVGRKKVKTSSTTEACSSDAEQDVDDPTHTHGHFTRSRKSLSRTCSTSSGYLPTTTKLERPATPPKKRGRPTKSKGRGQAKPSISLPSPTTTPPTTPTSKRLTLVALSRQSSHDDLESADLPLPSPVTSRVEDTQPSTLPLPAPLPPTVQEPPQPQPLSPSVETLPSSSLPTPTATPPPPSPPPDIVAPQPVTPTLTASIDPEPVLGVEQVAENVQMDQDLLPNPFDNVDPSTPLPSASPQPPTPAPARRLGAKARRWLNGGVWEQDRWSHWKPVDELNFGHSSNGDNGVGLSGGVGLGSSGWAMWKGMCKARVSIFSNHVGATAIRAHEARVFGPPPTYIQMPRPETYVRGPSPSQMEVSTEESDGGDTEPDEDQETDTEMITEEELDWAYPDSQSQSSEEGEERQGDVMDIVVRDDKVQEAGGGVFMEFTFPQPEPPIKLGSIRLQELRLRDMDQFKAVFDMDALAPPATVAEHPLSPPTLSLPSATSHVTRTRRDYFSRRFGYIATGTPINPRTRDIWGAAPSILPLTSLPFSPSPSDILSSVSQHWGTLRRREPPPPPALPTTGWVSTPSWMSEIVASGSGYDFSAWGDMSMLGLGWPGSDVMNMPNGGNEPMSVDTNPSPLEFPTSPSPSHSPPLGYVSA